MRPPVRTAAIGWLLVLGCTGFGTARAGAEVGAEEEIPISLHTSFEHYWRRYLLAETSGDVETAGRMLDEIKRLRVERNAFNLHDVAMAFVYRGLTLVEQGGFEEARERFDVARELDPDLPTAYWGLARLAEREGGVGFLSATVYRFQAQLLALRSERNGAYASWNLTYVVFSSLMMLYFIVALVMIYRYGVLLRHDIEERFGDRIGTQAVLAATLGVLLLPMMLTMGTGWLAPYWLAITFGYQSVRERVVSLSCLLVILATAPFAELYPAWARTSANPLYQAALSSVTGTFDLQDVRTLREAVNEHPEDRDLQFLLATQYKNLGDYELAANQYRRIIEVWPNDLEARINLGNIYFAQRDWDGALVKYNEVIGAGARLPMAFYNKSLAHAENFQFAERQDARVRAESVDAAAVAAHERRTGNYRVVADQKLDEMDILGKFYGLTEGLHEQKVLSFLTASFSNSWAFRFVAAPIFFGLLILVLEIAFKDRRLIQRCRKCGSAFCGRCQIGTGRKAVCTQCYHLFYMRDGVSALARNEKLARVEQDTNRRSRVFRLLSIIVPGAGHIGEGMPLVGALLLFFWLLGASLLILGSALYSLPDGLFGFEADVSYGLLFVMAFVLGAANVVARPPLNG
ncbi:MAG TPA: tetratricopeptide repeat protein [Vicinamibacteria bacterium]|nr:tetratricopeptide repeat protein [Vicinamibacteria bacterium]